MSVTEILQAAKKLSPSDQAKVAEALRPKDPDDEQTIRERQDDLHRRLMEEGLLKNIPPRQKKKRTFKPVPIIGKPISETIIEERR